jgi:hypothetical protein
MPTHLGGTVILGEHDYFESGWASQVIEPAVTARWMLGVSVPLMRRDLDDDRMFSFNPADPAQMLRNRDAQPGDAIGLGLTLSRRNSLGRGWEAGYWGLSAAQSVARLDGGPDTGLQGLSSISDGGVTVADTFNAADSHTLGRDYTLHNFELNRLRNGGVRRPLNRCMTVEWLSGLRFLRFDEQLQYAAIAPANPVVRSELDSTVQNTLFGAQIGGRTEWHLLRRFSLTMGGKIGLFNNRSNNTLTARNRDAGGASSTPQINNGPNAGDPFMFDRQKDDLAVVGEYEFGGLYRLSMRSRIKAGYRVLGVDGIADAEQNIPADFNDVTRLRTIDNHGDLVLRGAFVGVEWVR